jgi:glycerophosphoryl diester phosphodiesterase
MAPRLEPLVGRTIGFAHRGARAHAPENTLEAFRLALKLGATGLETDIWVTADGEPVCDHDGTVGGRFRRRPIADVLRRDLPAHIPSLAELYEEVGTEVPLSIDVKDADAVGAVLAVARAAGGRAEEHLWLCHPRLDVVASWRPLTEGARLVDSTRRNRIGESLERRAATLRERGVDALNLPHGDWSGGLITLLHRFERFALAWDAQFERTISTVVDSGIDGVFSDHVDRMVEVLDRLHGPPR